jgi:hypothetical protein
MDGLPLGDRPSAADVAAPSSSPESEPEVELRSSCSTVAAAGFSSTLSRVIVLS